MGSMNMPVPVAVQNPDDDGPPVKFNFLVIRSLVDKIKQDVIINKEIFNQKKCDISGQTLAEEVTETTENLKPNDNGLPFCLVCNKTFFSSELFYEHLIEKELMCRVCTEDFTSHSQLEEHFFTHNTVTCKVCKREFHFKRDLLRHRETSETCNQRTKCEQCDRTFLSKRSLKSHTLKFHSDTAKNLTCRICGKNFKAKSLLINHLKKSHLAYEYVECKFCPKLFLGSETVKVHIRSVHLDKKEEHCYVCEICGKVFQKRHSYVLHVNNHKDSESVICEICGKSVQGKRKLQTHIWREHRGIGEFPCEACKRVFTTRQKLSKHLKRCSKLGGPQEKKFCCEICGKAFATRTVLRNHSLTHTDEKPHVCKVCKAAFKLRVILTTHMRVHTNENKYFCQECGMAFKWKQTFTNHQKKCNGEEETPEVKRTLPAASFQNWPDRSDKFVSEQIKETVNLSPDPNPLSFCQLTLNANVPYLGYLLDDVANVNRPSENTSFQEGTERLGKNLNQGPSLQPAIDVSSPPQSSNLLLLESAPPSTKQDKATSTKINQQLKKPKKKFSVIRVKNLPRETNKSALGQHFLSGKTSVVNVPESPLLPNCEICNIDFLSDQLYEDHLRKDEFICRVCTLVQKSHEELEIHFSTHTPYKCKVCKKMFWCYKDLYHHRKTSSTCSNTTVTCDYCYKPFLNKKDLNLHKRKFHSLDEDKAEQQCIICEKKFALRQQLDCHMRNVHVVHEYVECRFCQKFCLGPERLKKHIKFSHVQNKGDELFPCTVCGKVFFNKMCLLSHKNVHDESMSLCELCGRSIKKKSMYDHIRREHDNPGFFKCEPCNKVFNTEKKLRNHLNSSTKHKTSQTAPVYCEICGKPYKTARILAAHLATHSDEKPFKCQICGAAFKQKVTLTTHHRTHTNASKYRCNQCGLSFKWKSTFDNHKKRCNVSQMRESYDYSPSTLMML